MAMPSADSLRAAIRDVADFPKPGIVFKDITPILSDGALFHDQVRSKACVCASRSNCGLATTA